MYNEQLETLISAALADGVLTEKEKQVLFKKAEAMGIDLDEFEMILDARLVELKKKEAREDQQYQLEMEKAKSAQPSAPKSEKYGDVRKCPACGAIVPSMAAKCPECGYEFTNVGANSTTHLLMQKIDEIQAQSALLSNGINANNEKTAEIEARAAEQQVEDRTIQAIQNFPIPNTKEDLLEFMTLCISNSNADDDSQNSIQKAWMAKMKQAITKVQVSMPNDQDAQMLIDQYEEMVEEGKAKAKRNWIIVISVLIAALLFCLIFS